MEDDALLAAARACFLEHGPAVAVSVIGERAGLSPPAIVRRFGTKEALLVEAMRPPVAAEFMEALACGPTGEPIDAQLLALGLQIGSFLQHMVPCVNTLAASGMRPREVFALYDAPTPDRVQRDLAAWAERAVAAGLLQPVRTLDFATAFVGALQVHACAPRGEGEASNPEDYVRAVVGMFLGGLGGARRPAAHTPLGASNPADES